MTHNNYTHLENYSPSTNQKTSTGTRKEAAPSLPDKSTWKGWAEIENDPVVFNTLLREWGVKGVTVNEIVPLDSLYACTPESTCGLVFLSRWKPHKGHSNAIEVPAELWFANQISTYSCASVAMMNIISNIPGLDLGPVLSKFVSNTRSLSTKDKGVELDSFHHVRSVHNSFATTIDMLIIDHQLAEDLEDERAKQNRAKRKAAQKKRKKDADADWTSRFGSSKNIIQLDGQVCNTRAKRKRPERVPKQTKESDSDPESDSGFHFTAYLPFQGHLWRLDGLRREPDCLGPVTTDLSWLEMAASELAAQWESAAANNIEFSLLSLVKGETDAAEVGRAKRLREDWGPALAEVVKIFAEGQVPLE